MDKRICPVCGHKFRGNGWDGIDSHWRSKHQDVMPYEEAWRMIQGNTYFPQSQSEKFAQAARDLGCDENEARFDTALKEVATHKEMKIPDNHFQISDVAIWFKHLHAPDLIKKLNDLTPEEEITLQTDGVIGRWKRMKTGKDGREVFAIRPVGSMKSIWNSWFKTRKGQMIEIREAAVADDYLAAASALFSEWAGPEDEEAFRDL